MGWEGAFSIEELLQDTLTAELPRPPEDNGIYVVTEFPWTEEPSASARVLYVGTTTGRKPRFRTRIGDLIADMFGFYGEKTGHHSGGQSLNEYCRAHEIHPLKLFIGWLRDVPNRRDYECHYFDLLKPLLNKKKPSDSKGLGN